MQFLKRNKWVIYWAVFGAMLLYITYLTFFLSDKQWLGNVLQTLCTVAGLFAAILMYLKSKEDGDIQFSAQQIKLQELHNAQLEALRAGTERQLETFKDLIERQINEIKRSTDTEIEALREATEKQVNTLQTVTYEQISVFESQMSDVTIKLSDNSILLAEILGRELEKAIQIYTDVFNQENIKYKDLASWKLLRTDDQRKAQLDAQFQKLEFIRKGHEYLLDKYNKLKTFLKLGSK